MKPVYLILLTNLIPVIGVLFFNWDIGSIIFLFWFEGVVVGFYNVLKMVKAQKPITTGVITTTNGRTEVNRSKTALIGFFLMHYGMFMFAFGLAFYAILRGSLIIDITVILGIILLLISHGYTYVTEYVAKKKYEITNPEDLMSAPYVGIISMLMILLFGSILSVTINGIQVGLLVVFLTVKTVVDLLTYKYSLVKQNNSRPGKNTSVIRINPPGIKFVSPFIERVVGAAYRKSVENGKWEKTKVNMDSQTVKEIEDYWSSRNNQTDQYKDHVQTD